MLARYLGKIACIFQQVVKVHVLVKFGRIKIVLKYKAYQFRHSIYNNFINLCLCHFEHSFTTLPNATSPVDFLSDYNWGAIRYLSLMSTEFLNLDRDIEASDKRWKKFIDGEAPEKDKFPQEWKNKTSLQKMVSYFF